MVEWKSSLSLLFSSEWSQSSLKYKCDIVFSVVFFFTGSKFNETWKRIMFIFYIKDLSIKNKMWRWGLIFLRKPKIQTVGNRKKNFWSVISFQKFLVFPIWSFPENAQCFFRAIVIVYWKHLLSFLLMGFIVAFLLIIQPGESSYDPPWFGFMTFIIQ